LPRRSAPCHSTSGGPFTGTPTALEKGALPPARFTDPEGERRSVRLGERTHGLTAIKKLCGHIV
jgi:hypothetical protein